MKSILNLVSCLIFSAAACGQQTVSEFNWADSATVPQGAQKAQLDGRAALKIENTNDSPLEVSLLAIEKPSISASRYAVQGEIRYEAAQGDGFLEMWSYFPPVSPGLPEGEYFSRTLGESGEMGKIRGTSDWRPFALLFNSAGASNFPTRLKLNLVLGGRGTVFLGAMKLVQYQEAKIATADLGREWFFGRTEHPWWPLQVSIWISSVGGAFLGILGGLIGLLCSRGRAQKFVIGAVKVQLALGVACAIAAIVAFAQHQPYMVWYPLALYGIVLPSIYGLLLTRVGKCYQERELRQMQSLDVSA